jgi:hypothetical protein
LLPILARSISPSSSALFAPQFILVKAHLGTAQPLPLSEHSCPNRSAPKSLAPPFHHIKSPMTTKLDTFTFAIVNV